jgi:MSHA biogenesis protein MshP
MSPKSITRQQGFLIPLAIFIVVVMGFMALALSRNSTVSHQGFTQELLSTQAFYAAETSTQRAMQTLFFPDASNRQSVDARCAALATTYNFSAIDGLQLCQSQVSCTCVYQNNQACNSSVAANYSATTLTSTSIYTVNSNASCDAGSINASRQIQASAYLEQE